MADETKAMSEDASKDSKADKRAAKEAGANGPAVL